MAPHLQPSNIDNADDSSRTPLWHLFGGGIGRVGAVVRIVAGDIIGYAPPLCLTNDEADQVVAATAKAVAAVLG